MTDHRFTTTADALAAFEAQGSLAPGTEGFWKVWGGRTHDIKVGDLILLPEGEADLITGTFEAKAAPMRKGLISPENGEFTYGALAPVIILRWGTHNILA